MKCSNCGHETSINSPSCRYCGKINYAHPKNANLRNKYYSSNNPDKMISTMKKNIALGGVLILIVIILIILIIKSM